MGCTLLIIIFVRVYKVVDYSLFVYIISREVYINRYLKGATNNVRFKKKESYGLPS